MTLWRKRHNVIPRLSRDPMEGWPIAQAKRPRPVEKRRVARAGRMRTSIRRVPKGTRESRGFQFFIRIAKIKSCRAIEWA